MIYIVLGVVLALVMWAGVCVIGKTQNWLAGRFNRGRGLVGDELRWSDGKCPWCGSLKGDGVGEVGEGVSP